mmetsp:Transcript_109789/g.236217  ORF Transcript_109789/g.236217 Transcript_109789/m.236217 type:complete len:249 (-) Transcript_109789:1577-2323(-)
MGNDGLVLGHYAERHYVVPSSIFEFKDVILLGIFHFPLFKRLEDDVVFLREDHHVDEEHVVLVEFAVELYVVQTLVDRLEHVFVFYASQLECGVLEVMGVGLLDHEVEAVVQAGALLFSLLLLDAVVFTRLGCHLLIQLHVFDLRVFIRVPRRLKLIGFVFLLLFALFRFRIIFLLLRGFLYDFSLVEVWSVLFILLLILRIWFDCLELVFPNIFDFFLIDFDACVALVLIGHFWEIVFFFVRLDFGF